MKKWVYMTVSAMVVAGGIFWSCQKDEILTSQEELMLKKATIQQVTDVLTWNEQVCAGEEVEFCLSFPQATTGKGTAKETNGQVQLLVAGDDPATEETETSYWLQIAHGGGNTSFCFNYTFYEAGIYSLRFKASDSNFQVTEVVVENCGCEESFDYEKNENGSYTFTYIPEETISNANLVFTFAQGVAVSGLDGWETKGSTRQTTMELIACETYSWTVTLTPDCSGHSNNSNVWTDFKVASVDENIDAVDELGVKIYSKKGNLQNIVISCPK